MDRKLGGLIAGLFLAGCSQPSTQDTTASPAQDPANFMAGPQVVPTKEAMEQVAPTPKPPTWRYVVDDDPMTGKSSRTATLLSTNSLHFGSPYGGEQHGRLYVRRHPSHGSDVAFAIERGQILCSGYADDCPIKIRFDDEKAFTVTGNNPSDHSTETVFLPRYKTLTAKMAKATTMRIQFNAYQEGAPVLEFNVAGFDPSKLQ